MTEVQTLCKITITEDGKIDSAFDEGLLNQYIKERGSNRLLSKLGYMASQVSEAQRLIDNSPDESLNEDVKNLLSLRSGLNNNNNAHDYLERKNEEQRNKLKDIFAKHIHKFERIKPDESDGENWDIGEYWELSKNFKVSKEQDVYKQMASEFYGVEEDKITLEQRSYIKTCFFKFDHLKEI